MMEGKKKEKMIIEKAEDATEAPSQPPPSEDKSLASLKAKPKILKRIAGKKNLNIRTPGGTPQGLGKAINMENGESSGTKPGNNNGREDGKEEESRDENVAKSIANKKQASGSRRNKRKKEQLSRFGKEQQNWNNRKKFGGGEKMPRNRMSKGEHGNRPSETKKGSLGGLIFMCNANTKPDCFQYQVMGVSVNKKDVVLGVRPGLKLFLYDYDLKLMYGIYKATSAGCMELEPTAFKGAFPVQVRFRVLQDCYPLPESIFRKAIMENYNQNHKFKTELTVEQVKRLRRLFQPAKVHPNAPASGSSPRVMIRNTEIYEQAREPLPRLHIDPYARDVYDDGETRVYHRLSLERDQRTSYREVSSVRNEDFPRGPFLTEKEYRSHGLQRETHHLTAPIAEREPVRHDPRFLTEQEYRVYGVGPRRELMLPCQAPLATTDNALSSYQLDPHYRDLPSSALPATTVSILRDPYYARKYGSSAADLYPPPPVEVGLGSYSLSGRREARLSEISDSRRREIDETERYSRYASDALSDYNQIYLHPGSRPDAAFMPVSSRYSFAGPSPYH